MINKKCSNCGKEINRKIYINSKNNFCDRKCKFEWQRKNFKAPWKGKKQPKLQTLKISQNPNRNRKISIARIGMKFTKKHRENISKGQIGRKPWNKGLNKKTSEILKQQGEKHSKKMKGRIGNVNAIIAMANKNRGQQRTDAVRKKISNSHKGTKKPWSSEFNSKRIGNKNPNWLGGVTPENKARFNGKVWKLIRKLILERDNFTCQKCGKVQKNLDVHHKNPWRQSKNDDLDNLVSLCRKCHREEESKIQKIIIASKTKVKNRIVVEYEDFIEIERRMKKGVENGN